MNRREAQDRIGRILELPRDGELQVLIETTRRLGTRFNDCAISQNVLREQATLTLTARVEQKQTAITLNSLDDEDAIRRALAQLFATCRHMPDDDEVMPAPGEVIDEPEHAFDPSTAALDIETVGQWVAAACSDGAAAAIDLAGLLSVSKLTSAYGDSAGGFACERFHRVDYHVTATGAAGSGWAEHQGVSASGDEILKATRRAIDKCARAQNPTVFEPRPVTVILEPQAVGDLLSMAFWYGFDQRATDEGRSAFAHHDAPLGRLSLYSDPADPTFPMLSFLQNGQRLGKATWLDAGALQQLPTSRFWAQKNGLPFKPRPNNLALTGDGTPLDELIRDTDDGILVTRFWYIRATDPNTLGFTGMTRDGTFRIEGGEVTHPVVDMRWNESVLRVLNNVSGSSTPRATGEFFPMAMPALKVDDFRFSSLSQ